jgi:hypothetical protein
MRLGGPGVFVVASIFSLVIAGCGSDGGSEAAAERAPRLSKAVLLKKGTAICDRGNKVIVAGFKRAEKADAAAERVATQHELDERAARVVLPVRKMELRRLRALGLPKEGTRQFQTMLAAMEEGIEKGEGDHFLLLAKKAIYAFREASEVGIRYGLTNCWLQ